MLGNAPSFSFGSFRSGTVGSWAGAASAALVTSSHPVVESGIISVTFRFPGAAVAVVVEVLGDAMGPAVRDGLSFVVFTLRFGFASVAVVVRSVVLLSDHSLE